MSPKGGGGASPLACQREHLEQKPHRARIGKPRRPRQDRRLLIGSGVSEPGGRSGRKTKLEQKFALRHGPVGGKPNTVCRLFERGEIDMGGEIDLARQSEGISEAMAMDGLQRIADTGLVMTVIGDKRGNWRLIGPRGESRQKGRSRGPRLDDGAVACVRAER